MTRSIRFYVKKRGERRTDSPAFGTITSIILFSLMFVVGSLFAAYLLVAFLIPEWRVNTAFVETTGVVVSQRLATREPTQGVKTYRPEIQILYDVQGKKLLATTYDISRGFSRDRAAQQAVLNSFPVEQRIRCWYDPRDPTSVVVARDFTWGTWLLLVIPLSFVIAGGTGLSIALLRRGKSVERQAAMAGRPIPIEFFGTTSTKGEYPNVPQTTRLTESPGTRLAFRLPVDARPMWLLGAVCTGTGVMTMVSSIFVFYATRRLVHGAPDILFFVLSMAWLLVGVGGFIYSAKRLIAISSIGQTILEISAHPIVPGDEYQLFLRQPGRVRLANLSIALVCVERATFRQGTNTRSEARRVVQVPIGSHDDVPLSGRRPFEGRYELHLAPHAMHSFKSAHNSIEWKLLVSGKAERGIQFERLFPIVVYPDGQNDNA